MSGQLDPIVVEHFELLLRRLQVNLNHSQSELNRMNADQGRVAREAMGLYAGLTEAIRRLNRMHIPCDDLLKVLDKPGEAPLNWPNATPEPAHPRPQADLAAEYDRIFKPNDQ